MPNSAEAIANYCIGNTIISSHVTLASLRSTDLATAIEPQPNVRICIMLACTSRENAISAMKLYVKASDTTHFAIYSK